MTENETSRGLSVVSWAWFGFGALLCVVLITNLLAQLGAELRTPAGISISSVLSALGWPQMLVSVIALFLGLLGAIAGWKLRAQRVWARKTLLVLTSVVVAIVVALGVFWVVGLGIMIFADVPLWSFPTLALIVGLVNVLLFGIPAARIYRFLRERRVKAYLGELDATAEETATDSGQRRTSDGNDMMPIPSWIIGRSPSWVLGAHLAMFVLVAGFIIGVYWFVFRPFSGESDDALFVASAMLTADQVERVGLGPPPKMKKSYPSITIRDRQKLEGLVRALREIEPRDPEDPECKNELSMRIHLHTGGRLEYEICIGRHEVAHVEGVFVKGKFFSHLGEAQSRRLHTWLAQVEALRLPDK